MAAISVTYSNAISKSVNVNDIYLETSFIFDLLSGVNNPSLLTKFPKVKETKSFYDFLISKKAKMWTSYLSVEEIIFKYYSIKMQAEREAFEVARSFPKNSLSYSDFKKKHPADFAKSYNNLKGFFIATFIAITNLNIKINLPKEFQSKLSRSKGERIAYYASCLLEKHILEPADAFHISTARCSGTKIIATNDLGFKNVDNITVFVFK